MTEDFLVEETNQVATVTFNRPEKRNSLNVDNLREFETIIRDLRDNSGVRVVIITGSGNTFCSGAEITSLKGVTDQTERDRLFAEARRKRVRLISRNFSMVENLEQVTIAAVNGYAVGGGWGLALACDFRLAIPGAQFWVPEVDYGAPLSMGASARLYSMIGAARAKEIIMTCDRYTSEQLSQWGLVTKIIPEDKLLAAAHELADQMLAKSPKAITGSKLTINALAGVAARESITIPDHQIFIHSSEMDHKKT